MINGTYIFFFTTNSAEMEKNLWSSYHTVLQLTVYAPEPKPIGHSLQTTLRGQLLMKLAFCSYEGNQYHVSCFQRSMGVNGIFILVGYRGLKGFF
jgi:hypothetical protein